MRKIIISVVPSGNFLLLFLILFTSNFITVNEIGLSTADFFLSATFCALKYFLCYAKMGNFSNMEIIEKHIQLIMECILKGLLLSFNYDFAV